MAVNGKDLANWLSLVLSVGVLLAGVYGYRWLERDSQEMKLTIDSLQNDSGDPADDPIEKRLAAVETQLKKIELLEGSLSDLRDNVQSEDTGSLSQRVTSLEGQFDTIENTLKAEAINGAAARLKLWREDPAAIDMNDIDKGPIGAMRNRDLEKWLEKRGLKVDIDGWLESAPVEELYVAIRELEIP